MTLPPSDISHYVEYYINHPLDECAFKQALIAVLYGIYRKR